MIPFSVLGPTRGNRQADLWEAMMNVNSGNRIRSLRYLSGMYNILLKFKIKYWFVIPNLLKLVKFAIHIILPSNMSEKTY